jgi:hypothetical protein
MVMTEPEATTQQADIRTTPLGQFTIHGVTFHFAHRVLEDFARDLARGLSGPLSAPIDVFVGTHLIASPPETGRPRLGIQTEHMVDSDQQWMWRVPPRSERNAWATDYDAVLDLSPQNRRAYRFLPIIPRRKITFGPHIFPDQDLAARFVDAPPVFVGWTNDRRRAVLERVQGQRKVDTLDRKAFGAELDRILASKGAVLNIHFQDGVYSEYPRFLKACLAGKPVLSEPMAGPLIEGEHYLPLEAELTPEATERIFASLRDLAAAYRFRTFLESVLKKARARA